MLQDVKEINVSLDKYYCKERLEFFYYLRFYSYKKLKDEEE